MTDEKNLGDAGAVADVAATIDSEVYKHTFFGILNKEGGFWTPLAFASSKEAEAYLAKFIAGNPEKFASMLDTHRAVPVRIQLTHLSEQGATAGVVGGKERGDHG
jgi:hypothetical protein